LDKNKTEIDKLKSEITNKEKEVNTLYENIHRTEGTAGTKKAGKGPVLKKK
jgi:peptidoglycan hydrolase CwlO-like protein